MESIRVLDVVGRLMLLPVTHPVEARAADIALDGVGQDIVGRKLDLHGVISAYERCLGDDEIEEE